jgi:hypothetical protein
VLIAAHEGRQTARARELDADFIAPTEIGALTEIMKRAGDLMDDNLQYSKNSCVGGVTSALKRCMMEVP